MAALGLLFGLLGAACWLGIIWFGFGETGPAWLVPLLFASAATFLIAGAVMLVLATAGIGPELSLGWSWQ